MTSTAAADGDGVRILSYVIIISQSETINRNIEF